jgi:hypothetical protein
LSQSLVNAETGQVTKVTKVIYSAFSAFFLATGRVVRIWLKGTGFVSGHGFQPCRNVPKMIWDLDSLLESK